VPEEEIKRRDLYSYRYRGEESADLPPDLRRRLFYSILDNFRPFSREAANGLPPTVAAAAEIFGVDPRQEAGARYLAANIIRMRGLPRLSNLNLQYRWLEQYLLTEPAEFCLDVIDILLASWLRDKDSVTELNELFEDHELPYEVRDYRVERRGPALARRVAKRVDVAKAKLAELCPAALEELEEAEVALRSGEDENDWSRVGHQCRVALQDFAEAAYQRCCPSAPKEPLPLDKPLIKLRRVLGCLKSSVSVSQSDLISAMLEPVNAIVQKTEHRSAKEGKPLTERDAERCFVMTALLLDEALALFTGAE
jgi:hypothetical protein